MIGIVEVVEIEVMTDVIEEEVMAVETTEEDMEGLEGMIELKVYRQRIIQEYSLVV